MLKLVGLDLGSSSIKAVEVEYKKGKKILRAYASSPRLSVSLRSEQVLDREKMASVLKSLFSESNFSTLRVNTALSEADVFSRIISLPKMSSKELAKSIRWEAQQYIPRNIEEVNFDYQVIDSTDTNIRILLIAAPKDLVTRYMKLVNDAGLDLAGVETSMQALSRLEQFQKYTTGSTLIINLGANTTDLGILCKGSLRLARSLAIGGDMLARAVSQKLKIPEAQAEEYKRSYGLNDASLEGKISEAIAPVLKMLGKEIQSSISFYTSRGYGDTVERLVLCGGTAQLPGLLSYFASTLGLEAQLIDPFLGMETQNDFSDEKLEELGPSLSLATGLAFRRDE
jgi:type IV pilus assembly protein PilM